MGGHLWVWVAFTSEEKTWDWLHQNRAEYGTREREEKFGVDATNQNRQMHQRAKEKVNVDTTKQNKIRHHPVEKLGVESFNQNIDVR